MSQLPSRLMKEFSDKDYRHGYADDFLNTHIAAQIRALREQRGWTQAQLAERAAMKQSRISAMEDVNYSSWGVRTLARLAEAFDVTISVCFKSFRERVMDIDRFSPDTLRVAPYAEDLLISLGASAPPDISDTSPLVPLRDRAIQTFVQIMSSPMSERAAATNELRQPIVALMNAVEGMYGNRSKQYRGFSEWLARLATAMSTSARAAEEEAIARLKQIDDKIRHLNENPGISADVRAQVEEIRAHAVAAIEALRDERIAVFRETARREIERTTTFRDAVLEWIDAERARIRQLATATAKSDVSVEQFLREIEAGWQRVERGVLEQVHA